MQARIRPPVFVSGGSPTLGALLGTAANSDVLMEINSRYGSTFFGERYDQVHNAFMQNIVVPMRQTVLNLESTANALCAPDAIVNLNSIDAFSNIPQIMHLPILTYAPIRALLEQGRIDGFGWDPSQIPEEDDWGRYLSNGYVADVGSVINKETGEFKVSWKMCSTDVERTQQDIDYIRNAREMIDHILETTELDPTSIKNFRG